MKIRINTNTGNKIACTKHIREVTGLGLQDSKDIVDSIVAGEDYSIELNWLQVLSVMKDGLLFINQESLSNAIASLVLENEGLKKQVTELAQESAKQAINLSHISELEDALQKYGKRVQTQSEAIADLEKRLNDEINYGKGLKKTIESTRKVRDVMERELTFKQGLIDELLGLEHGSLSPVVDK